MTNPYFLAGPREKTKMVLGSMVALAESLADPASTIVVGMIFKEAQKIISQGLSPAEFMHKVNSFTYALVGITAYTVLTSAIGYMIWSSVGFSLGHKARIRLYKAMIQRKTEWFDEKTNLNGLVTMHYKDIQDLEVATGVASFEIISMFMGCCVEIGVAFYFSWAVTLVCLAGVPVLVLIGTIFTPPITRRVTESKSLLDTISERTSWILSALQTVKIFQREKYEWKFVNGEFVTLLKQNMGYRLLFSMQEGLSRFIVLLIFMQGFYFGSYMVRDHGLSAGNVVTVFWSCLNASALLQTLMGHLLEWNKGKASAERLAAAFETNLDEELYDSIGLAPDSFEHMYGRLEELGWKIDGHTDEVDTPSKLGDKNPWRVSTTSDLTQFSEASSMARYTRNPPKGHITFSEVVFSYPSRPEIVFASLDLEFPAGSITFVLGRSGSGKSSIAGLLSKQYSWQAGEINIDGHDISLLSTHWIENNVYICEQTPKLFDIPIADNIRIGSRTPELVTEYEIQEALEDTCSEFVNQLPQQLDTLGSANLSGGQQQRIALARARIRDSPIMLYDEATSALDPHLQAEVYERMLSYRHGKTTLIITHDVSVIPEGYPIYVMNDGRAEKFSTKVDALKSDMFKNTSAADFEAVSINTFEEDLKGTTVNVSPVIKESVGTSKRGDMDMSLSANVDLFRSVPDKCSLLIGLAINVAHACVNPVFSFIFSKLVMGILDPGKSDTTMWAMLVLACAAIDGLLSFARIFVSISAEKWLRYMRGHLLETLMNYRGAKLSTQQVSYYNKLLMSDMEKIGEIIIQYWPGLMSMVVLGLFGFIWAIAISWKLTLVGVSLLPVFVTCNQLYKLLTTRWNTRREAKRAQVVRLMMDLTSEQGYRTVKVQHLELYFKSFYLDREAALNDLTPVMTMQTALGYGLLKCFPYALESLLLWYGMKLMSELKYPAQHVISIFTLLMFTIVTIDQLTGSIGKVGTGFEALSRLVKVLHDPRFAEPEITTKSLMSSSTEDLTQKGGAKWHQIDFHRVGIEYPNGTVVLGNFTESVQCGETVAVVGASGVGKSTIARFLLGLETANIGEIVVDGHWDLEQLSLFEIRQNVAMVGQAPLDFFHGTIRENLLYGLDPRVTDGEERMMAVTRSSGAHEFIERLEDGYDTVIKAGLLSGGQMQRLGITRALIRQPRVLIFDESTSALDIESKAQVKAMITDMKERRDMIILIITHQMDVAKIADRVVRLD